MQGWGLIIEFIAWISLMMVLAQWIPQVHSTLVKFLYTLIWALVWMKLWLFKGVWSDFLYRGAISEWKSFQPHKFCILGSVQKYFGGGAGQNGRGAKKFWVTRRRGDQKVFLSKGGGSKKFGQIESIMKIKMHNLLPKLIGYRLRLDLYFKIFPGPSAGPTLHLTLKMPPLAHPQIRLAFV